TAEIALQHARQLGRQGFVAIVETRLRLPRLASAGLLWPYAHPLCILLQERLAVAIADQPTVDFDLGGATVGLRQGKLLEVGFQIDEIEDNERQADHGENHGRQSPGYERYHLGPSSRLGVESLNAGAGSAAYTL